MRSKRVSWKMYRVSIASYIYREIEILVTPSNEVENRNIKHLYVTAIVQDQNMLTTSA